MNFRDLLAQFKIPLREKHILDTWETEEGVINFSLTDKPNKSPLSVWLQHII